MTHPNAREGLIESKVGEKRLVFTFGRGCTRPVCPSMANFTPVTRALAATLQVRAANRPRSIRPKADYSAAGFPLSPALAEMVVLTAVHIVLLNTTTCAPFPSSDHAFNMKATQPEKIDWEPRQDNSKLPTASNGYCDPLRRMPSGDDTMIF